MTLAHFRHNGLNTATQAALQIALSERWQHLMIKDVRSLSVGQRLFQARAHFNPHFALIGRNQQHEPVIIALSTITDASCVGQRPYFDALPVQAWCGDDAHLMFGVLFQLDQRRSEFRFETWREYAGHIFHPARLILFCCCGSLVTRGQAGRASKRKNQARYDQNLTSGAFVGLGALAWKDTIGLAP
jgi:hypothetical protein